MEEEAMYHDIRMMLNIPLTEEELAIVLSSEQITLTAEMVARSDGGEVGCFRCEAHISELSGPCPGEPVAYASDGTPIARNVN